MVAGVQAEVQAPLPLLATKPSFNIVFIVSLKTSFFFFFCHLNPNYLQFYLFEISVSSAMVSPQ